MKNLNEVNPENLGQTIIECIQAKKGREIVHIDLTNIENSVCEYFIISHGESNTQVKAIAEHIEEKVKEDLDFKALHAEGYENMQWILLDYNTVVVHIFQKEIRDYYRLEELWADGKMERIMDDPVTEI